MTKIGEAEVKGYYVYTYYDPRDGSPIYVGLGRKKRAFKHWKKKANNALFQNVLNKIRVAGLQPRIEFVAMDLSLDVAKQLEVELIALYGRRDISTGKLCNMTAGGDGALGYVHTAEARAATARGIEGYWKAVDRGVHGAKISATFASRTQDELAVVRANISRSRTPDVRRKIGAVTKLRMQDGRLRAEIIASAHAPTANEKRKDSLKKFANSEQGRGMRRAAANARWSKYRDALRNNHTFHEGD